MRIHFPSLTIGFLTLLSLVLFVAAQRPDIAAPGRFQLEATQNYVFVLDRDTGKVWQKYLSNDAGQIDQDFALPKTR